MIVFSKVCVLWNILIIGLLAPFTSNAQEPMHGNTINSWPPYMFLEDGRISGIATDIVKATFKKANIELELDTYPWARAYQITLTQKDTLIYMLYRTEDRESLFKWVGPIVPAQPMYFYKLRSRSEINISSLEDAKQYTVGVVRNVANHKFLLKQGFEEGKNIAAVTNPQQNLKKLLAGRIDLLIGSELTLAMQMKELGASMQEIEPSFNPIETKAGYIGFNLQTSDETIQRLQHALDSLQEDGTVKEIQNKYINRYLQ
ncbi:ABC transporter substrate-binding protein [Agarivorans sp. Alg241-V36]|uniref:substrate-binding periplasmic protein n=1 Tax=Agarivorans sp. Alg241-V36 TaxID=2305992 RepID=UPI0013D3D267|nr:transporter substrate-binding domain-containing protein [Agarivorans sp. Alg241-V36]